MPRPTLELFPNSKTLIAIDFPPLFLLLLFSRGKKLQWNCGSTTITMGSRSKNDNFQSDDTASPGKVFIGGLPKDTTYPIFNKHFGKYGEITDSVIMKDRYTGQPRGFGFITFANPFVVDKVIEDTHIINGKQVEIKRTIPKGAGGGQSKDFKTKKIFVGGIPSSVSDDEFRDFFSKYGNVVEHQIIRDHETNRPRGFGFIIFDSEEIVDEMLSKGTMIDMADTQVEIKKAEPKKPSNPPPPPSYGSKSRPRSFNDEFGGYGGPYGGFDGGYGSGPYRYRRGPGSRFAGRYGYGSGGGDFGDGEFGGGDFGSWGRDYGGIAGGLGGYRGQIPFGYSDRFGPYGDGSFGSGGYGGPGLGGYGRGSEGYGGYGGSGYGGSYESGPRPSFGAAGGPYGRGYGGSSRYHPYAR